MPKTTYKWREAGSPNRATAQWIDANGVQCVTAEGCRMAAGILFKYFDPNGDNRLRFMPTDMIIGPERRGGDLIVTGLLVTEIGHLLLKHVAAVYITTQPPEFAIAAVEASNVYKTLAEALTDGTVTYEWIKLTGPGRSVYLNPTQAPIIGVLIRTFDQPVCCDPIFLVLYCFASEPDWPNSNVLGLQVDRLRPSIRPAGLYIRTYHSVWILPTDERCQAGEARVYTAEEDRLVAVYWAKESNARIAARLGTRHDRSLISYGSRRLGLPSKRRGQVS